MNKQMIVTKKTQNQEFRCTFGCIPDKCNTIAHYPVRVIDTDKFKLSSVVGATIVKFLHIGSEHHRIGVVWAKSRFEFARDYMMGKEGNARLRCGLKLENLNNLVRPEQLIEMITRTCVKLKEAEDEKSSEREWLEDMISELIKELAERKQVEERSWDGITAKFNEDTIKCMKELEMMRELLAKLKRDLFAKKRKIYEGNHCEHECRMTKNVKAYEIFNFIEVEEDYAWGELIRDQTKHFYESILKCSDKLRLKIAGTVHPGLKWNNFVKRALEWREKKL